MFFLKFSLWAISRFSFQAQSSVLITLIVSLLSIGYANSANRIFDLHIKNGTDVTQGFWLKGGENCYEGTGANSPGKLFLIPSLVPGESFTVTLARVQGNGCDGSQGYFSLQPHRYPNPNDVTNLQFDNAGGLGFNVNLPNRYHAVLSEKSLLDESYTWTMLPIEQRLKQPIDQRLTRPRNYITTNTGEWDHMDASPSTLDQVLLRFEFDGFFGNYFQDCNRAISGAPFFHAQHIQRLDDKDGKAYFMVTQSRPHNGSIYLVETFDGVLNETTGRLNPPLNPIRPELAGKIIWEEVFTGIFNGAINPIGSWNHPGKMAVIDGVLIVAAQNWSEGALVDGCSNSTTNPYQRGDSEDAVLFFDVRDPSAPQYWGKMTATELEVPLSSYRNGLNSSFAGTDRMISVVSLLRTDDGKYVMNVGGSRNGAHYATWETDLISPNIENWNKREDVLYTTGEYGDDFEAYQAIASVGGLRNMSFDMTNAGSGRSEAADGFLFQTISSEVHKSASTPVQWNIGFEDDDTWVTPSHHATRKGMPLIYAMKAQGARFPEILQVYDSRNTTLLPHIPRVVNNLDDSGPGSLREAIGYGGTITFDDSLDGKVLVLQEGPLIVSRYDVNIDATTDGLPNGIIISGGFRSRVLHITKGNRVSLHGVTIKNGINKSEALASGVASNHRVLGGGGILNEGTLVLSQSTVVNNISENDGGGIFNSGTLEIQNSTITGNYSAAQISKSNIGSFESNGNIGGGGGISNIGVAQLVHTTVANNTDFGLGVGGIKTLGEGLLIDNSIIAANNPSNQGNLSGSYSALGANIINSNIGALRIDGPVPIEVPNLELQPLDNYGSRTPIMPPLDANSPIVDSALPTIHTANLESQDQSGNLRPIGAAYDIGAVEAPAVAIIIESISTDQFGFASGAISISPEPRRIQGVDYFLSGVAVTLTAEPNIQSEFVSWGGSASVASCGTSLTCNVTIAEGLDVRVTFQPKPLLSINYQGHGEISLSPAGDGCSDSSNIACQRYSTGSATFLTATASANSEFNHWDGDCLDSGVSNVASITMNGDKSCTAVFNKTNYQLTVSSLNGSVASDPAGAIDCGDDCTETYLTSDGPQTKILTASVNPGSVFVRWYGDTDCYDEDEGDGLPLRISLTLGDADVRCSAMSVLQGTEFALTIEKIGAGVGKVTAEAAPLANSTDIDCASAACSQTYSVNSVIQLTATPERGSLFAGWNGDPDCNDGQVTMSSNITCSAKFTSDLLLIDGSNFFGSLRTEFEGMLANTPVGGDFDYWSVQTKKVEPIAADLETYSRIIWYTGNASSSPVAGPSPDAEIALSNYLDNGGCFLLSSSEYFAERGLTSFAENYLGIKTMTDNIGKGVTHTLLLGTGLNSKFKINSLQLTDDESMDLSLSDSMIGTPALGNDVLFRYADGGDAAVSKDNDTYRTAFFGFPFLGFRSGDNRNGVMNSFLNYCGAKEFDDLFENNDNFDEASHKQGTVSLSALKILPGNDDYFRWTSNSNEDARFTISFVHASGDLAMEVYDNTQALIASAQSVNDNEEIVISNVESGQTYFVRVFGADNTNNRYALNINTIPSDISIIEVEAEAAVTKAVEAATIVKAAAEVEVQAAAEAPFIAAPNNIAVAAIDATGIAATNSAIAAFLGGATANDNIDVQVTITHDAGDQFALGLRTVTFSATDSDGHTGSATATVTVADQGAPVITLIGNNSITLNVGDSFIDEGATVTDNVDTDLTILKTGSVDTSMAGTFTVTYSVSDSAGNAAQPVTRSISVKNDIDTEDASSSSAGTINIWSIFILLFFRFVYMGLQRVRVKN